MKSPHFSSSLLTSRKQNRLPLFSSAHQASIIPPKPLPILATMYTHALHCDLIRARLSAISSNTGNSPRPSTAPWHTASPRPSMAPWHTASQTACTRLETSPSPQPGTEANTWSHTLTPWFFSGGMWINNPTVNVTPPTLKMIVYLLPKQFYKERKREKVGKVGRTPHNPF